MKPSKEVKLHKQRAPIKKKPIHAYKKAKSTLPSLKERALEDAIEYMSGVNELEEKDEVISVTKLTTDEISNVQAELRGIKTKIDEVMQREFRLKKQILTRINNLNALESDLRDEELMEQNSRIDCFSSRFETYELIANNSLDYLEECQNYKQTLEYCFSEVEDQLSYEAELLQMAFEDKEKICLLSEAIEVRSFRKIVKKLIFHKPTEQETIKRCNIVLGINAQKEPFDFAECQQLTELFDHFHLGEEDQMCGMIFESFNDEYILLEKNSYNIRPLNYEKRGNCKINVDSTIQEFPEYEGIYGAYIELLKESGFNYFRCSESINKKILEYIEYLKKQVVICNNNANAYKQELYCIKNNSLTIEHEWQQEVEGKEETIKELENRIASLKNEIGSYSTSEYYDALPIYKFSDQMLQEKENSIYIYESEFDGKCKDYIKLEYMNLQTDILKEAIYNNLTKTRYQMLSGEKSNSIVSNIDIILKQTDDVLTDSIEVFGNIKEPLVIEEGRRKVFKENARILHDIRMKQLEQKEESSPQHNLSELATERNELKKNEPKANMPKSYIREKRETLNNQYLREEIEYYSKLSDNDFYK